MSCCTSCVSCLRLKDLYNFISRVMGGYFSSESTLTPSQGDSCMNRKTSMGEFGDLSVNGTCELSFPKVELHIHLDGSVRHETILQYSKSRGIPIYDDDGKQAETVEDIKRIVSVTTPRPLGEMLKPFDKFLPVIRGSLEALEQVAYEMCEDQAKHNVIYFEGRYGPHLLVGDGVTPQDVVKAIHRGFTRGEQDFKVKARSILCAINGLMPEMNRKMADIAAGLKDYGVVAVDVAGSSKGSEEAYDEAVVEMFQQAKKLGIHRTAHAGESGSSKDVEKALKDMYAQRIGHGYRVMQDLNLYKTRFLDDRSIHLEACPYSSHMTLAVTVDWPQHPIVQWAHDDVNFSISRDDPTCFNNTMTSELKLARDKCGLNVHQLWKAQLNAAQSCFLPDEEKQEIINKILAAEPKY